jgi:hypothetical protein
VFRAPQPGDDNERHKRIMGLHPDCPLSGRIKREKENRGNE